MTLVNGLLYSFADELKLNNADRVTIYVRVEVGGASSGYEFRPVARYAGNPEFRAKGRASYPSDQGVISKAWQDGSCFDNQIPNYDIKDTSPYTVYHESKYGISKQLAGTIKMKSRLYYGWRIRDSSGKDDIAVLILESTNKTRFTKQFLDDFFGARKRFLREFVSNIKPLLPSGIAGASGL